MNASSCTEQKQNKTNLWSASGSFRLGYSKQQGASLFSAESEKVLPHVNDHHLQET